MQLNGLALWARARLRAEAGMHALANDPLWYEQPDALDWLINGFRFQFLRLDDLSRLLHDNRDAARNVYARPLVLADKPDLATIAVITMLSEVILEDHDPPAGLTDLAAARVEWLISRIDKEYPDEQMAWARWLMTHLIREYQAVRELAGIIQGMLAIARLRQGRTVDAMQMAADVLKLDLDRENRADVLATLAMARHTRMLSGQDQLDEALLLAPDTPMVKEAVQVLSKAWFTAPWATRAE